MLAFVLPAEEALLPHVGEAIAAAVLGGALFEAVAFAGGVGGNGVGMVEDSAIMYVEAGVAVDDEELLEVRSQSSKAIGDREFCRLAAR